MTTITPEQWKALRTFAAMHGRTWKHQLMELWQSGQDIGYLRQIRNTIGPRGLATIQVVAAGRSHRGERTLRGQPEADLGQIAAGVATAVG